MITLFAVNLPELFEKQPKTYILTEFFIEEDEYEIQESLGTKGIIFKSTLKGKKELSLREGVLYRLDDKMHGGPEPVFIFTSKKKALKFITKMYDSAILKVESDLAELESALAGLQYLASRF